MAQFFLNTVSGFAKVFLHLLAGEAG